MPTAAPVSDPRRRRRMTPLQTIRLARTLTQGDLARICDIAQQTYSQYETGEVLPPPDRRAKIAAVLGTSSEVLWPPGCENGAGR